MIHTAVVYGIFEEETVGVDSVFDVQQYQKPRMLLQKEKAPPCFVVGGVDDGVGGGVSL